jgi:D-alanine transaminase
MPDIAFINNAYLPLAEARVPIEDRGYQFADGVYEVVVANHGEPFLLDAHLNRLADSLRGIAMEVDLPRLELPKRIAEGIARSGYDNVLVYLQITRGVASRDHAFPPAIQPSVVMTFKPMKEYDPKWYAQGVALFAHRDIRWANCNIKSIALLPNVLLKSEARRRGFFDCVIHSDEGIVREASSANIFIVTNGVLVTPPKSNHILPGVTRGYLLERAAYEGIPTEERDFTLDALCAADEAFITSSTMNAMPVTRVDAKKIGGGTVGPITSKLAQAMQEAIAQTAGA